MKPTVSIILTSYNKPWFIAQTIESILKQTWSEWELFIMDDHSNDVTVQLIKKYVDNPRIFYRNSFIEKENRYKTTRYATLINEAIPLTKGKYVTYITDDTVYLPNRLSEMVKHLESNPSKEIVFSSQLVKIVDRQLNCLREFKREATQVLTNAADIVDHCSVMHTRNIAEKVREKYGTYWNEDPLYWCRGDAAFWNRLNVFQPFYPIRQVLDITYKTPHSVQTLFQHLPNNLPNGILVKGTNEEVYLIDQEKRRLITPAMFSFFKYDEKEITEIPDPLLHKYEEGDPVDFDHFPNYCLFRDEKGELYYFERYQRRKIGNSFVWGKFRFNIRKIIEVETERLKKIPLGPDLNIHPSRLHPLPEGRIYKNQVQYWILKGDTIYPIDKKVLQRLRLEQEHIELPGNVIKQYKIGDASFYAAIDM